MSPQALQVLLPAFAVVLLAALFYLSLRGGASIAVIEIGTVYSAVVVLYAVVPLVAFVAIGMQYEITNDIRMYALQPTPDEIARIGWLYVLHLAGFVVAYRLVRGRARLRFEWFRAAGRVRIAALVALLLFLLIYFRLLALVFNLSAATYQETYLALARLPLFVAQVTNHFDGMRFVVLVALLVALFADFRKYRVWIALALVAEAAVTFIRLGSRTEFVLLFFGAAFLYHWLVRPIRERWLVAGAFVLIGLFQLAGVLRSGILADTGEGFVRSLAYTNEFEALFGNAFDVLRLKEDGLIRHLPVSFLLTDVFALVPQQLLPIEKLNPAGWYLSAFHPEAAAEGVGYAFGTIPESIVFGGSTEIVVRGALLGVLLAAVHRWCARQRRAFWPLVIYLWATLLVYQAFRNSTFCLLPYFVYRIPLVILFVEVVRNLASKRRAAPVAAGAGTAAAVP